MFRAPSNTAELVAFVVFAAIALVGALATILLRNPIRCAVGLFFHILALAGLYLTLGAQFLAVIQLLVYAGAVVVLFVFVIMLLGPAADTPKDSRGTIPRMAGVLFAAAAMLMVLPTFWFVRMFMDTRPEQYGTVKQVGTELFRSAMVPFEMVGVTLLVAVLGAFAVARGHHKKKEVITEGGVAHEKGVEPPHGAISGSRASEGRKS
jgi:NADH-quinone oxidoreductase subunit J